MINLRRTVRLMLVPKFWASEESSKTGDRGPVLWDCHPESQRPEGRSQVGHQFYQPLPSLEQPGLEGGQEEPKLLRHENVDWNKILSGGWLGERASERLTKNIATHSVSYH